MPDIRGFNPVFSGPPQLFAVLDNSGREEQCWPRDEFRVTENNVRYASATGFKNCFVQSSMNEYFVCTK